ncbi:hypothetical protein [Allokutzneria multivorans]
MNEPVDGMTISVRVRRDLVIVDAERFMAAAREAYRQLNPGVAETEVVDAVADAYDAVFTLLDHAGQQFAGTGDAGIWPLPGQPSELGRSGALPGVRVTDRPDGLSPAGSLHAVVLTEPQPLQDYGCFQPEDPFALPEEHTP